jgi:hypothetical protein
VDNIYLQLFVFLLCFGMNLEESNFYKGAVGYLRGSDGLRPEDEETGIYIRWWRLMRLSPVFWYATANKLPIEEESVAWAYKYSGDLKLKSFGKWWDAHAKEAFAEPVRPRKVRELNLENPTHEKLYEKSVVVEIPLTISKRKIFSELRKIVNWHYQDKANEGRRVNIASYSLANLKLYNKRYHSQTLDNEYFTLLYRILFPEVKQWVIADRLRLVAGRTIRATDSRDWQSEVDSENKKYLQAVVGRYLYKARFSRFHLERGTYAKYDKVDIDAARPFGEKRHEHYTRSTNEATGHSDYSDWQKWVRKEHWKELREHIIKKHRISQRHDIDTKDFGERFEKYLRGEINL